jgi:hypothetical protein
VALRLRRSLQQQWAEEHEAKDNEQSPDSGRCREGRPKGFQYLPRSIFHFAFSFLPRKLREGGLDGPINFCLDVIELLLTVAAFKVVVVTASDQACRKAWSYSPSSRTSSIIWFPAAAFKSACM